MKFYLQDAEAVLREVKSTDNGLSAAEAEKRLAENGKNKLKEPDKDGLIKKIISALADPMIIMLLVAALIQAVVAVINSKGKFELSEVADVLIILVVVIINTIMSLVQESKAEAAMEALMEMTAATSHVLRDGKVETVKSEDLVVGDVLVFEAGGTGPAKENSQLTIYSSDGETVNTVTYDLVPGQYF